MGAGVPSRWMPISLIEAIMPVSLEQEERKALAAVTGQAVISRKEEWTADVTARLENSFGKPNLTI